MSSEEIPKAEESVEESVEEPTATEETEEGEEPKVKKLIEPRLARVEYDYEARESDELSLNTGDVITVLEQDEGWWKGDLNGKIGSFPANHVKLIEVPNQSAEEGEDTGNSEGKKKKTLNKYGVKPGGLGSLFSGGVPTLKKRSQPIPETFPEEKHTIASPPVLRKTSVPSPGNQQSSPQLPFLPPKKKPSKPKKVEPRAEVLYDYDAEGDDEISLVPGTYVTILEKVDEDGWWRGRTEQGQIGLFPSTYVKEVKQQPVPEEVKSNAEGSERHETTQAENFTSEPTSISAGSPLSLARSSSYELDSPTLPKSPPPPMSHTTNETSSPPTPNRRSTHESSQAASPQRRSTHEPTSPTLPRSHDGEEHVTSRRPPSVVSPDLSIQPVSQKRNSVDNTPTSPEERPTAPPRQLSRPSSLYENKTDSQKSPTLAKPPNVPKSFSPAKPPVVSPIKRSSSKSDKATSETSPTEPVSPKTNRKTSQDQYDSSTALSEPENKDDNTVEDVEQVDEVTENHEETFVDKIDDKEAEVSEEEEAKDEKEVITETVENKEDEDTTGGHEVEPEEKKSQPQLPPLPSAPKLSSLGKDRPAIRNRKIPSAKNVKEAASQSQTAILLEAVESAKDEDEPKPRPVTSPPTPPKPEKPEKPVKPNTFKLPTLGVGVQLRPIAKKPPIETSTESTETTSSTTSSGIDTKPISGGVKGISSRFNQFGGIPNSSDVEFRLKKWFNEEINKVKSHFEAQLAEERSKREALEEQFRELISSLQQAE